MDTRNHYDYIYSEQNPYAIVKLQFSQNNYIGSNHIEQKWKSWINEIRVIDFAYTVV